MVSISSSKMIRERARESCNKMQDWNISEENSTIFKKIDSFLKKEYGTIPEKERIGKGIVYISRHVAKEVFHKDKFFTRRRNWQFNSTTLCLTLHV